jgi:CBS domain-containing protein
VSDPSGHRPAQRRPLRPGTVRLGAVGGVDILVQQSWFLIVLLIAVVIQPRLLEVEPGLGNLSYVAGVAFAVLLYLSVLLHEISHALAARRFEMPVASINLHFLGGATEIEAEAATPWREFVIAVVGPLTSLAIGGVCYALVDLVSGGLLGFVVAAWAGRVGAVLAVFYPLGLILLGYEPSIIDYLMAFMIGAFMWSGASQALMVATVQERLPRLEARRLARPAIGVPADLPLSEAIRRAQDANVGSLVVVSSLGQPEGVVNEDAVASTPMERRPWIPTGSFARRMEAGLLLPADLSGEELLRAMQTTPASEYVLVEPGGSVYGVLVTKDVDTAFRAG